eukprot:11083018-Heterocapsa_arctica.AAC.1
MSMPWGQGEDDLLPISQESATSSSQSHYGQYRPGVTLLGQGRQTQHSQPESHQNQEPQQGPQPRSGRRQ